MSFLIHPRSRWLTTLTALTVVIVILALTFSFALVPTASTASAAPASGPILSQVSSDPYSNSTSQHQTEVEPDSYSNGSTIVATTQVGRFSDGGASNIGWATSTDNGATWKSGFLPATTVFATPAGQYDRVSDPAVAYDAAHKLWMISSLAVNNGFGTAVGIAVLVNTSADGGLTWNAPIVVANANGGFFDKDWIVCDTTSTSAYFGHCYVEWDITSNGNLVQMSTSSDGGASWSAGQATADSISGLGGQPLVQPNGTVIVPFLSANATIAAFTSTNGGASWNNSVTISSQTDHQVASLRSEPLPSARMDSSGIAYVVWQDCRFENSCNANDLVLSTSSNGTTWSSPQRIPIDAVGSNIDHFIPGLAVDPTTSGTTAHLALTYYYYPTANCTGTTCQLEVGFVSSTDAGANWSTATTLTSTPLTMSWLANTTQGYMVGDYISTSFSNGTAFPLFVAAAAPNNGGQLNEALFTTKQGLAIVGGTLSATSEGAHDVAPHPAPSVYSTAF